MQEQRLFVANLPKNFSKEDVRKHFSVAGTVREVHICTHKEDGASDRGIPFVAGESRGFGFVEMATTAEAVCAIDTFDGAELGGRKIHVAVANERPTRA